MKWEREKRQRDEKVPWGKKKNNSHVGWLIGVKTARMKHGWII